MNLLILAASVVVMTTSGHNPQSATTDMHTLQQCRKAVGEAPRNSNEQVRYAYAASIVECVRIQEQMKVRK